MPGPGGCEDVGAAIVAEGAQGNGKREVFRGCLEGLQDLDLVAVKTPYFYCCICCSCGKNGAALPIMICRLAGLQRRDAIYGSAVILNSLDTGDFGRLALQLPQFDTLVIASAQKVCDLISLVARQKLDGLDELLVSA